MNNNSSMKKTKILIIGGSTAGLTSATRLRRLDENAEIAIIEKCEHICFNKAIIPYYISDLKYKKESFTTGLEEKLSSIYNIHLYKNHEAVSVHTEKKNVMVTNLKTRALIEFHYDQLIIATGFHFYRVKNARTKADNFFVLNHLDDAIKIHNYLVQTSAKKILIVGANYYAITIANNYINKGFDVSLISENQELLQGFDEEFSYSIREELLNMGVNIHLNSSLRKLKINESNNIYEVITERDCIATQLIIYVDNIKPRTRFLSKSAVKVGSGNKIIVNQLLQTSNKSIYAVGIINDKLYDIPSFVKTQKQARLAASNIINPLEEYKDQNRTIFLKLNAISMAITGSSERELIEKNHNVLSYNCFSGNKERFIPYSRQVFIKLTINQDNHKIMGAQVYSKGNGVEKIIDTFSTAIYAGLTIEDLSFLNLSYFPEISSYRNPVNLMGQIHINNTGRLSHLKKLKDVLSDQAGVIIDVRSKVSYKKKHLENSLNIPLGELRENLDNLPRDKNIYIYSHVGLRSYIAERILRGHGFQTVYSLDGGMEIIELNENVFQ